MSKGMAKAEMARMKHAENMGLNLRKIAILVSQKLAFFVTES